MHSHATAQSLLQIRAQGRGELLVSLCHQPAANRLTVVILKARSLPKMDITGLCGEFRLRTSPNFRDMSLGFIPERATISYKNDC
jgi:hypothetical protein